MNLHMEPERPKLDQIDAGNLRKSLDKATASPTKDQTRINIAKNDICDKRHPAMPAHNFNLNSQVRRHSVESK